MSPSGVTPESTRPTVTPAPLVCCHTWSAFRYVSGHCAAGLGTASSARAVGGMNAKSGHATDTHAATPSGATCAHRIARLQQITQTSVKIPIEAFPTLGGNHIPLMIPCMARYEYRCRACGDTFELSRPDVRGVRSRRVPRGPRRHRQAHLRGRRERRRREQVRRSIRQRWRMLRRRLLLVAAAGSRSGPERPREAVSPCAGTGGRPAARRSPSPCAGSASAAGSARSRPCRWSRRPGRRRTAAARRPRRSACR